MAYDEDLAERIHGVLAGEDVSASERRMFGGIAFMVDGHLAGGVPRRGWSYVEPAGFGSDDDLRAWIERDLAHVRTLPAR